MLQMGGLASADGDRRNFPPTRGCMCQVIEAKMKKLKKKNRNRTKEKTTIENAKLI